ncbi:hypothetical protein GCM10009416_02010 [Craurococcus roseus]|uniref:Calcium-binding protein n=1 Tax=Craurococcus roseus TaxID=77585 RepID=A0ABN1EIW4_9PROT
MAMAIEFGTPDADTLPGTDDPDILFGLDGDDSLNALGAPDAVLGSTGDDSLHGDAANGPFLAESDGNPGRNLVFGDEGNDTVFAGYGEDTVLGGAGNDLIFGRGLGPPPPSGVEFFEGDDDGDALLGGGGDGNDSVSGGDLISGGAGEDLFLFGREGVTGFDIAEGVGDGNRAVVTDFRSGEDVLDVSGYRGFFLPSGTPAMEFLGTGPFVEEYRPQLRYEVQGDRTIVQIFSPFGTPPPDVPLPPAGATVEIELRGIRGISEDDLVLG